MLCKVPRRLYGINTTNPHQNVSTSKPRYVWHQLLLQAFTPPNLGTNNAGLQRAKIKPSPVYARNKEWRTFFAREWSRGAQSAHSTRDGDCGVPKSLVKLQNEKWRDNMEPNRIEPWQNEITHPNRTEPREKPRCGFDPWNALLLWIGSMEL